MTGAEAVCGALKALGVDCVFGVPGTQNVELFEALRKSRIRTVLASHELAASFMANGYYRASGKPGVLITIPGPGFTYALTGLAEARLDSAALLYLVGAPATSPGTRFQLQAIDQLAMAAPIVKQTMTVRSAGAVSRGIMEAFQVATTGEPGPVLVQLESAAITGEVQPADARPATVSAARVTPDEANLDELVSLFLNSTRPVFLLGQGALAAAELVRTLAERHRIPVVTTVSARGILAEDHPMACGFDVLRGNVDQVNGLFNSADLILALGCKLTHNGSAGFQLQLPADRLVHVDADAAVPGANYPARLCLTARAEHVLMRLDAASPTRRTSWTAEQIREVRAQVRKPPLAIEPVINDPAPRTPGAFFSWLREVLPRDAILVTDSGLHQGLARRHYDVFSPRGLIVPSDFQSMGFGLPAAIGARLAAPTRPVVALIGDGGFLMSGLELLTAVREDLPLLVIVFNDGRLNQIRLQQIENYGHEHAVRLENPDFASLAAALGAGYFRFGSVSDADLRSALEAEQPTLLEVAIGDSSAIRSAQRINRAKAIGRTVLSERMRNLAKGILGTRTKSNGVSPNTPATA